MVIKLILVRHAETTENSKKGSGRFHGHMHGTLSTHGMEQARALARRLVRERIDIVYCSDLRRAKQTIAPILKLCPVKVVYTKALREGDMGIFTGKTKHDYETWKKSETGQRWLARYGTGLDWAFPWGESSKDLSLRAKKFVEQIIAKERGKTVLIMTHGKTKTMILLHLLGKEYRTHRKKYSISNTGVSIVHVDERGRRRARLINCTRHLKNRDV
jgi:broad specificity phosphatase PhoE